MAGGRDELQGLPVFFTMRTESDCSRNAYLLLLARILRSFFRNKISCVSFPLKVNSSISTNCDDDVACLATRCSL